MTGGLAFGTAAGEATFLSATVAGGDAADSVLVVSDGAGGFTEVLALIVGGDPNDLAAADIVP